MNRDLHRLAILALGSLFAFNVGAEEAAPPEFDTGRPQPPRAGHPVMGAGLAMSHGYYRGVPKGELAGWTVSLWFQPNSNQKGELFNVVLDEKRGTAIRVRYESGKLTLSSPGRKDGPDREISSSTSALPGTWHQVVLSYAQGSGPALYLNGQHVGQGQRGGLGYATLFDNYHFGAAIQKGGQFGDYFDGSIDDFALFSRPFDAGEVARIFEGEEILDSLVAFNDFENVNHRDFAFFSASDRDEKYLDEGKALYEINCTSCHSKDGKTPPINPLARSFTEHRMENGGDPFRMFQTLTYGFRNMMPSPQLNPEERYKVIHYLREKIVRELAPDLYTSVDSSYTATMPDNPMSSGEEVARVAALAKTGYLRDYGKALISPVVGKNKETNGSDNALTIDLGSETTISYDLGTMRSIGAWRGGFLNIEASLHHKLRAPGLPNASAFDLLPGSDQWQWAWEGKAENEVPDLAPRTVWPEEQIRYLGHYSYGEEIVISYAVQGREVLESPLAETIDAHPVIHRRLTVSPGDRSLEVTVLGRGKAPPKIDGKAAEIDGRFAHLQASDSAAQWRVSEDNDLVLHLPASEAPMHLDITLSTSQITPSNHATDLTRRLEGGPTRWPQTHTIKGKLAVSSFQGYALDSLPVPLDNAYNSWMRTSCLTFFPDGRLAVGTLSGDIWIVSGIDESLEGVTWKRFAAGLYEPMGMKVVAGVLTVGTRGRLVRLHDENGDGEADFYEAFFNEPEPDPGWHAYSFDLEVGDDGAFYYARVGGFSDWSVPGGMVRVAPDGKAWEVLGAGMRVPNGVGRLPDGRITFSDNQGTYVPASKISVTRKGDFHGAGKWPNREGDFDPEKIVEPLLYLPQELDSSSGSQLWVDKDARFGPLGEQYFHASYGRARTMYVMLDEVGDGVTQAAAFSMPLTMESGTLRLAKNPADGQLYTSGLTGWQAGATREGSIQRIRYTGESGIYVTGAKARKGRLELTFDQPVDPASMEGIESWRVEAWNYQWSSNYGSPHFKASDPGVEGTDLLAIDRVEVLADGTRVRVEVPDLKPCHTLKLDFAVKGVNGAELSGPVYFTIHQLPE